MTRLRAGLIQLQVASIGSPRPNAGEGLGRYLSAESTPLNSALDQGSVLIGHLAWQFTLLRNTASRRVGKDFLRQQVLHNCLVSDRLQVRRLQ